jgi:hypothetical protein
LRKLTASAIFFTAAAAYGVAFGIGAFGGVAMPTGDMAAGYEYDLHAYPYYKFWPDGGDLGLSPKFGAKLILGVIPSLDLEAGVAHAIKHPLKTWEDVAPLDEPETTMTAITIGANFKVALANAGLYVGAGGGYYWEDVGFYARWWDLSSWAVLTGVTEINKPGVYVGGGFTYRFGKFVLDVNPRWHHISNDGEYEVRYEQWRWHKWDTWSYTSTKPYNDTFVDVLVGLNYYFL